MPDTPQDAGGILAKISNRNDVGNLCHQPHLIAYAKRTINRLCRQDESRYPPCGPEDIPPPGARVEEPEEERPEDRGGDEVVQRDNEAQDPERKQAEQLHTPRDKDCARNAGEEGDVEEIADKTEDAAQTQRPEEVADEIPEGRSPRQALCLDFGERAALELSR